MLGAQIGCAPRAPQAAWRFGSLQTQECGQGSQPAPGGTPPAAGPRGCCAHTLAAALCFPAGERVPRCPAGALKGRPSWGLICTERPPLRSAGKPFLLSIRRSPCAETVTTGAPPGHSGAPRRPRSSHRWPGPGPCLLGNSKLQNLHHLGWWNAPSGGRGPGELATRSWRLTSAGRPTGRSVSVPGAVTWIRPSLRAVTSYLCNFSRRGRRSCDLGRGLSRGVSMGLAVSRGQCRVRRGGSDLSSLRSRLESRVPGTWPRILGQHGE